MCDFCESNLLHYDNRPKKHPRESVNKWTGLYLVYDETDNTYDFWVDVDDSFYSGVYQTDVKFCPMCGRKLAGEEVSDESSIVENIGRAD